MSDLRQIKRALISVFDKSQLSELAHFLISQQIALVSTGKTAQYLRSIGIPVEDVSTLSQFPEILDGRVKTLHPRVFAGLLFDRDRNHHWRTIEDLQIAPIDLVVVNLYPFASRAAEPDCDEKELVELIDVGGSAMLRGAAKNFASVTVLSDPRDYHEFIEHYQAFGGTDLAFRRRCARRSFSLTSAYDHTIAARFEDDDHGGFHLDLRHEKSLRYGENPHQCARLYSYDDGASLKLATISSRAGKELSYNNLLDAHAAICALRNITDHRADSVQAAVIVKHGIPCGAAHDLNPHNALKKALASDPMSAFGGIVALASTFDLSCAHALGDGFFEVIIAKDFTNDALAILSSRKNLRLVSLPNILSGSLPKNTIRTICGGALVQDFDTTETSQALWTSPTEKKPSDHDMRSLDFAFRIVKSTPSNAISLATADQLLGLGAGQPNRIQSVELAIKGARARGFDLTHAAMASDAFFPFADAIHMAHAHGIRLIIQPGGSLRDKEVIAQANIYEICMVFTHQRHFRH